MADQASIFETKTEATQPQAETETAQTQEPSQTVDAYADLLASIKSDDGRQKYSDVASALKSLPHANEHISKLQAEMEELRAEVTRRQSAEEVLQRLESKTTEKQPETPSVAPVDLAQIEQMVDQRLTARQTAELQKNNLNSVVSKVGEVYGDKAEEMFYATAKEAGLSMEQINNLAATAPSAVLKLMGLTNKTSSLPGKPFSSVNTQAMQQNSQGVPSAKVPFGASTKQMVDAWRNAKPTAQ